MRRCIVLAGFLCLLRLGAVEAAPAALYAGHPLSGTLWDTRSGRQADEQALLTEAAGVRWVLLGEKHDNAAHHQIQARIVAALGRSGRPFSVVWEMAEPEQAAALKNARLQDVDELGDALDWEARGWPAWTEYRPIAEAALRYGLQMVPGNPSRALVRGVSHGEALPPALADRLDWTRSYSAATQAELREELAASHCGALPAAAIDAMLRVQRLWDAWIADSMLAAGGTDAAAGAILIAGAGHVREDRAVPWFLKNRDAGDSLTLAVVEVAAGAEKAADYRSFDPALYDYVWFTARVDDKDPCAAFGGAPAQ